MADVEQRECYVLKGQLARVELLWFEFITKANFHSFIVELIHKFLFLLPCKQDTGCINKFTITSLLLMLDGCIMSH